MAGVLSLSFVAAFFAIVASSQSVVVGMEQQKLVVDALKELHKLLDDDENGGIDSVESKDFLWEELQSEDDCKEKYFHGDGGDPSITVEDLLQAWMSNPVRNWTNEDMLVWLQDVVQLPQYVETFVKNRVTGEALPILAGKDSHFMQKTLGITFLQHRKKLELRATDVVLFGPVTLGNDGSLFKDVVVFVCLTMTTVLMWYAYKVRQKAQQQVTKMMADVESLQQAEKELRLLQDRLDGANEVAFQDSDRDSLMAVQEMQQEEIERLRFAEEELEEVRAALVEAHQELAQRSYTASSEMRHLLRLTYEREKQYHEEKKKHAMRDLESAREECEKINKKRSSLLGALRLAHGSQLVDIDGRIAVARASLVAVTHDLQEQQFRWKRIEALCGQRIDSALTSPISLEPVPECGPISRAGETFHSHSLLSSVSGGDSASVCSTKQLTSRSVSDQEWMTPYCGSMTANHANALVTRSTSDSGAGAATKRKLPREKRISLVGVSGGEAEEGRQPGSISSSSSCSSLSSLSVHPASSTDTLATASRSSQRRIMPLHRIGKQNSDPSMSVSKLAADEQTSLPLSDVRDLYQNKSEYAKDYNSLACVSTPPPKTDHVSVRGRRSKDRLRALDHKRPEENVSDSEVIAKDVKKRHKLFWSKVTK